MSLLRSWFPVVVDLCAFCGAPFPLELPQLAFMTLRPEIFSFAGAPDSPLD